MCKQQTGRFVTKVWLFGRHIGTIAGVLSWVTIYIFIYIYLYIYIQNTMQILLCTYQHMHLILYIYIYQHMHYYTIYTNIDQDRNSFTTYINQDIPPLWYNIAAYPLLYYIQAYIYIYIYTREREIAICIAILYTAAYTQSHYIHCYSIYNIIWI